MGPCAPCVQGYEFSIPALKGIQDGLTTDVGIQPFLVGVVLEELLHPSNHLSLAPHMKDSAAGQLLLQNSHFFPSFPFALEGHGAFPLVIVWLAGKTLFLELQQG